MTLLAKLGIASLGGGSVVAGSYGIYELVRPKNIEQQLKWEGKELLDVSSENNKDDSIWETVYSKYSPTESGQTNTEKFKNGESEDTEINNKNKLREKCGKVFILPLSEENKHNLEQARKWCVKPSETTE